MANVKIIKKSINYSFNYAKNGNPKTISKMGIFYSEGGKIPQASLMYRNDALAKVEGKINKLSGVIFFKKAWTFVKFLNKAQNSVENKQAREEFFAEFKKLYPKTAKTRQKIMSIQLAKAEKASNAK